MNRVGDGEGNQRAKKEKGRKFEEIQLLTVTNQKTEVVIHNLTLFKPYEHCFIAKWARKSFIF